MLTPNGIGLSPDGSTLYVAETETARLWSYPVIVDRASSQRQPLALAARRPPGASACRATSASTHWRVEAGGNICVATLVARRHHRVLAGRRTARVPSRLPEGYCTNICFGGPDLRTAYVTLSGYGQLFAARWPRPGLRLAA